jgi:hypothetical protein
MAQNIKLKRSSVAGKVPTTTQLEAGEIAINTADGKLYFERDDASIQTIVTTNAVITGSLNINGPITGSDVRINQWGSVSASLATISSQAAVVPTLDQVTDQGSTTTNFIEVGSISAFTTGGFIAGVFKTTDGPNTVILESAGTGGTNPGSTILQFRDSKGTQKNASITYGGNAADYLRLNTSAGATFGITGSNIDSTYVFNGNNSGTGSFSWDLGTTFIQKVGGGTTRFLGNATTATSASFATTASFAISASYAPGTSQNLQQVTDNGNTTTNDIKIGNSITFDEGFETTTYISSSGGRLSVNTYDEVVGFNTLTPSLTNASAGGLHVHKNTGGQASIRLTVAGTGSSAGSEITHNITAGNDLYIQNRASGSIYLGTNVASTGINQFTLSTSGNLTVTGTTNIFGSSTNPSTQVVIQSSNITPGYIRFNDGVGINSSPGYIKYDHSTNDLTFGTNTFEGFKMGIDRRIKFNAYGSGTVTGTAAYLLAVDSTGNVIENPLTVVSASYAVSASHAELADLATNSTYAQNVTVTGKNLSGGTIAKGTPLYFTGSGTAGNLVGIFPADAGNPARMPAGGIAGEAITDGSEGLVLLNGYIDGVDTSTFFAGDEVFVAAGGGYTRIAPTGSALVQKLGNIEKISSVNGSGVINGPGTARSVPNIASGFTWVGAGNGVATPTAVSSLSVANAVSASYASTADAVGVLNQNVTIAGNLNVFGTASFTYTTASQLNVEEAFISVNVATPAQRFGGLVVYDSGSVNVTASLAYDSLNNDWKFFHEDVSTSDYSVLIFGPLGTDKENTPKLTGNWITKAQNDGHGHHIGTSSLFDDGTVVRSIVPVQVTGSLTTTGKLTVGTVDNYGTDPDKFLAIVNGEVVYRTGAQVLSDIGGQTSGTFVQNSGAGGTARYIMRYADSNSATTSSIYEDTSGNIGIKKTTPGAPLDVNGSAIISGSLTVTGTTAVVQQGIQVSGVGSLAIASISTTTYRGAFFDYVLSSDDQVNRRAGTLTLVWTASDIEWKDTSTMDIGNTDGAEFAPTNSGGNANIVLSLPSGDWTVRGHLRYM